MHSPAMVDRRFGNAHRPFDRILAHFALLIIWPDTILASLKA
jgi:hypothetical protein